MISVDRQGENRQVILLAFYNTKALGVRYLERALERAGYQVQLIFYKEFNSRAPAPTSQKELDLLCQEIRRKRPLFIGLSVMSSMYLETVDRVMEALRARCGEIPLVCGGAFASLFPSYFLKQGAEYVIRGDGEIPLVRLADRLRVGEGGEDIPSLCCRREGEDRINPIGEIRKDIDGYGTPVVDSKDACFIDGDRLRRGDPQRKTLRYEVIASRGCPFTCSYCSCAPLHRLMPRGIPAVRTRSVESVMEELRAAKAACPRMMMVHFYDEIFPNLPGWVEEFTKAYRREIGLPFAIWSHPKAAKKEVLAQLTEAGLTEVIMGIQSGSDRVRREVFHRFETREDILRAAACFQEAGVPWVSYDFMLQHPFETIEDLKETYFLVKDLPGDYILQLHGLNFLPGTDIVPLAVEQGLFTQEELDAIMFAPMEQQFGAYWKQETSQESQLWYILTALWQWPQLRPVCLACETDPLAHRQELLAAYRRAQRLARRRDWKKKGDMVRRRFFPRRQ